MSPEILLLLWYYWTSEAVVLAPTQIIGAQARDTVLARKTANG